MSLPLPPVTTGIWSLVTLSTQVAEPCDFLPSSKLGPDEKTPVAWLKYHVRAEYVEYAVVPPDRIDTVALMEVIARDETADGNSGPYSIPPSMLMSSLVCDLFEPSQLPKTWNLCLYTTPAA